MTATIVHPEGIRNITTVGRRFTFDGQEFAELICEEELRVRKMEIGAHIGQRFDGTDVHLIGVSMGGLPFMWDVARATGRGYIVDELGAGSYGDECHPGEV